MTGRILFAIEGYILGFNSHASNHLDGLVIYYISPLVKSKSIAGGLDGSPFDDKAGAIIFPHWLETRKWSSQRKQNFLH